MITFDQHVKLLLKSQLLEQAAVAEALGQFKHQIRDPDKDETTTWGEFLVETGRLTQWQHQLLMGGRYKGFFLGKYKILRSLGTGGMSQVYLAEHVRMKRRVALKVLPLEKTKNQAYLDRFILEARALASLDHPHIVHAYSVDSDAGLHYLVMQYIEGEDLQQKVDKGGALPCTMAADYIRQAADGLAHAHERNLIHRDIKPANLLVDRQGTVKLTDLGLAMFAVTDEKSLTRHHGQGVLGTTDYLAPEQAIDSHAVDARTDIYSLGCTLYFLLTGHAPFPDGTLAEKLLRHQTQAPKAIRLQRQEVPVPLASLCERMMQKKPNQRIQTAAEVRDLLADWMGGSLTVISSGTTVAEPAPPAHAEDYLAPEPVGHEVHSSAHQDTLVDLARPSPKVYAYRQQMQRQQVKQFWMMAGGGVLTVLMFCVLWWFEPWAASASLASDSKEATLLIEWDPKNRVGGKLTVNGKDIPLPVEGDVSLPVPPGHADIALIRPGYEAFERTIDVSSGRRKRVVPWWVPLPEEKEKVALAELQEQVERLAAASYNAQLAGAMRLKVQQSAATWTDAALKKTALALMDKLKAPPSVFDRIAPPVLPKSFTDLQSRLPLAAVLGDTNMVHWTSIRSLAFHPKEPYLVSCSQEGCLRLWNTETQQLERELLATGTKASLPQLLCFSPDGQWLATLERPTTSVLMSIKLRRLPGMEIVHSISDPKLPFSGFTFVGGETMELATWQSNGNVSLWNTTTGTLRASFKVPLQSIRGLAGCPSAPLLAITGPLPVAVPVGVSPIPQPIFGRQLAEGSQVASQRAPIAGARQIVAPTLPIQIWDIAKQAVVATLDGHMSYVSAMTFSPDATVLATTGYDGKIKLTKTSDGSLIQEIEAHDQVVTALKYSPDGSTLVSSGGRQPMLKFWNTSTGELRGSSALTVGYVNSYTLDFQPDGTRLAVAGQQDCRIRLLDSQTGSSPPSTAHQSSIVSLVQPAEDQLVSLSAEGLLCHWKMPGVGPISTHNLNQPMLRSSLLSPDGNTLACSTPEGNIQLLSLPDATPRGTISNNLLTGPAGGAWDFDASGKQLVVSGQDSKTTKYGLHVWDTDATSLTKYLPETTSRTMLLTMTPDGRRLLAGDSRYQLHVWSTINWQEVHTLSQHKSILLSLACTPDSSLAALSGLDKLVTFWNLDDGRLLGRITTTVPALCLAFSPDGTRLAMYTASGSISIWTWNGTTAALENEYQLFPAGSYLPNTISSYGRPVQSLRFHSDGRHLLASCGNGLILILRIAQP